MKKCLKKGGVDGSFFEPTPEEYFKQMIKPGTQCDAIFINFFSYIIQRDFKIYHVHTGEWTHIYGSFCYWSGKFDVVCLIF